MTAMLTPATPIVLVSAGVSAWMSAAHAIPTCTRKRLLLVFSLTTRAIRVARVGRAAPSANQVTVKVATVVVITVWVGVVRIAGMFVAPAMRSSCLWIVITVS